MSQDRKKSFLEAFTNTSLGLATSFVVQLIIYPALGIEVSLSQNIFITLIFFTVSVVRGYFVRRFFNK